MANVFIKSTFSLAGVLILAGYLYTRGEKDRSGFNKVTGKVVYYENSYEGLDKDSTKFRYIILDSYPRIFELFTGKDWGDFKPVLEQLDKLKTGDNITIYYDDNQYTENDQVNRLASFVDRGNEVLFVKGGWDKVLAKVLAGMVAAIFALMLVLKEKGKID